MIDLHTFFEDVGLGTVIAIVSTFLFLGMMKLVEIIKERV